MIKLKNNAHLIDQAQHKVQYTNANDYTKTEHRYFKSFYQVNTWTRPRIAAIKATRKASTLLFYKFQFAVIGFANLSPQTVFQLQQKQGIWRISLKK
ncbi:transposase [Tetragenococcus halophilus]|uniref:Transposase n=2 Tax=Tetragenococcus halophilus TaxID=51669 RepID=A0AAN1SHK2_TETHN|nr:transposase [Tetragenococcus halophilus]QGP75703.1 hypothetical protein GLW17_02010 [Tetragenococcus halophilus]QXN87709.1 transposase [Tetragenococcus halophilus]WJS82941.1 transposase [Tetragenococcus halophilus]BAK94947.1 putative transposase [Tetragenococcus halophilus NBRC 12172]